LEVALKRLLNHILALPYAGLAQNTVRNRLIALFEEWVQVCRPTYQISYKAVNVPNAPKLTWGNCKSLMQTYELYIPQLDADPDTLQIWALFCRQIEYAKTRTSQINDDIIASSKANGEVLLSLLTRKYLRFGFSLYFFL
jgi:hypothetical protein